MVLDEPVSSLDCSEKARILNLLKDLQERKALTYLLIAHDLAVVEFFCDEVAAMYGGRIVERAKAEELWAMPLHPYSKQLLAASAGGSEAGETRRGRGAWMDGLEAGDGACCVYLERCGRADEGCRGRQVGLEDASGGHFVACRKAENG